MNRGFLEHFHSRRSVVMGHRGMVATSQPLATTAGLSILMAGGNAADAAVAAAAALTVTEPASTGLGGDCFALFYDASARTVTALNGSGHSPAGLTLGLLAQRGLTREWPPRHPLTATVPGTAAGWSDLLDRHGKLTLAQVLAPAIELAEEGFPVAPVAAYFWELGAQQVELQKTAGGTEFLVDGRAPRPGETMRLPTLARTLRLLASGGPAEFYQGEIARKIAETVQARGGVLTAGDLAAHQSTWETPVSTSYRGWRVWECPPNGQGLAALLALNLLEGFDLRGQDPLGPARLHLVIEAMRVAFADIRWYVADPVLNPAPVTGLLSKSYAATRRELIDPAAARLFTRHGVPRAGSDTVYLAVADRWGNACSFINSVYMGFGTGIVPPGTGLAVQNRGACFNLEPGHPNVVGPGKRPYHTIIPAMATRESDDALLACFGVMGGYMQPQAHVQILVGMLDDRLDPQAALDRPRFCLTAATPSSRVELEDGLTVATMSALSRMGHEVLPVSGPGRAVFGRGQIISRDPETGNLSGGSDPRADGQAASW